MTALCSKCNSRSEIFDSRIRSGTTYRRRKCKSCNFRWGTVEVDPDEWEHRREITIMERKRLRYAKEIIERFLNT